MAFQLIASSDEERNRQQKARLEMELFKGDESLPVKEFSVHLRKYLELELKQDICEQRIFESVISTTLDVDPKDPTVKGDGFVYWDKFQKWLDVYGPLELGFYRARAVCSAETGDAVEWYRLHDDRARADEYIDESLQGFTFLVRPGKGTDAHAFTLVQIYNNQRKHMPISRFDKGYVLNGDPWQKLHATIADLVLSITADRLMQLRRDGAELDLVEPWADKEQILKVQADSWLKLLVVKDFNYDGALREGSDDFEDTPSRGRSKSKGVKSLDDLLKGLPDKITQVTALVKSYFGVAERQFDLNKLFWERVCVRLDSHLGAQHISKTFDNETKHSKHISLNSLRIIDETLGFLVEGQCQIGPDTELTLHSSLGNMMFEIEKAPEMPLQGDASSAPNSLFWYRFFELADRTIPDELFAKALRLFLTLEYPLQRLAPLPIFTRLITTTADLRSEEHMGSAESDGLISVTEWVEFLDRFGPVQDCYRKAASFCLADGACAEWFRMHFDRPKANEYLLKHRAKFVVRLGRQPPDLAFTVSLSETLHCPVRNELGSYTLTGDQGVFHDMRELLQKVCRDKGFNDELSRLNGEEAAWIDLEAKTGDSSNVQASVQFDQLQKYFQDYPTAIEEAKRRKDEKKTKLQENLKINTWLQRDSPNLDNLSEAEKKDLPDFTVPRSKSVLEAKDYHARQEKGLSLTHMVVNKCLLDGPHDDRSKPWLYAFDMLHATHEVPILHIQSLQDNPVLKYPLVYALQQAVAIRPESSEAMGDPRKPLQANVASQRARENIEAVYKRLLGYPLVGNVAVRDDMLEKAFLKAAEVGLDRIAIDLLDLTPATLRALQSAAKQRRDDTINKIRNAHQPKSTPGLDFLVAPDQRCEECKLDKGEAKPADFKCMEKACGKFLCKDCEKWHFHSETNKDKNTVKLPASAFRRQTVLPAVGDETKENTSILFERFRQQMANRQLNVLHWLAKCVSSDTGKDVSSGDEFGDERLQQSVADVISHFLNKFATDKERKSALESRDGNQFTAVTLAVKAGNIRVFNTLRKPPFRAEINPNNDLLHLMCTHWHDADIARTVSEINEHGSGGQLMSPHLSIVESFIEPPAVGTPTMAMASGSLPNKALGLGTMFGSDGLGSRTGTMSDMKAQQFHASGFDRSSTSRGGLQMQSPLVAARHSGAGVGIMESLAARVKSGVILAGVGGAAQGAYALDPTTLKGSVKFNGKNREGQTALWVSVKNALDASTAGGSDQKRHDDVLMFLMANGARVGASELEKDKLTYLRLVMYKKLREHNPKAIKLRFDILKHGIKNGDIALCEMILKPGEKSSAVPAVFSFQGPGGKKEDLLLIACDEKLCVDEDGLDQRSEKIVDLLLSYKPADSSVHSHKKGGNGKKQAARTKDDGRRDSLEQAINRNISIYQDNRPDGNANANANTASTSASKDGRAAGKSQQLAVPGMSGAGASPALGIDSGDEDKKGVTFAEEEADIQRHVTKTDFTTASRRKAESSGFSHESNVGVRDETGKTPLHLCGFAKGKPQVSAKIAVLLLAQPDTNITAKDNDGRNALHYACKTNQVQMVDELIKAHMDLEAEVKPDEEEHNAHTFMNAAGGLGTGHGGTLTPSHLVALASRGGFEVNDDPFHKHLVSVRTLEEGEEGMMTALHLASLFGYWQIALSLLDHHVKVDPLDKRQETPLTKALYWKKQTEEKMTELHQWVHEAKNKLTELAAQNEKRRHLLDDKQSSNAHNLALLEMQSLLRAAESLLSTPISSFKPHTWAKCAQAVTEIGRAVDAKDRHLTEQWVAKTHSIHEIIWETPEFRSARKFIEDLDKFESTIRRGDQRGKRLSQIQSPSQLQPVEHTPPSSIQLLESYQAVKTELTALIGRMDEEAQRAKEKVLDYDRTIDALLKNEADIDTAIKYCSRSISDLLNVRREMRSIDKQFNYHAKKINDEITMSYVDNNNAEKTFSTVSNFRKIRDKVFEKKLHQIVLNEVYRTRLQNTHVWRLIWFMLFLILLSLMGVYENTKNSRSASFLYENLKQNFANEWADGNETQGIARTFEDISQPSEFWIFLFSTFNGYMYNINPPSYWQGSSFCAQSNETSLEGLPDRCQNYSGGEFGGWLGDGLTKLIGRPRLRQQRSSVIPCPALSQQWKDFSSPCFGLVKDDEDTESFGPGHSTDYDYHPNGTIAGCPRQGLQQGSYCRPRYTAGPDGTFEWNSENDLDGVYAYGQVQWYTGSGYTVTLPSSYDPHGFFQAREVVRWLEDISWIDSKTRVVFVEWSVYSAQQNHFATCRLQVEFPTTGGAIPSALFTIQRVKRYVTAPDMIVLAFQIIFLILFVAFYAKEELVQMWKRRCLYFANGWNGLDFAIITNMIAIVTLHFIALGMERNIDWFTRDEYVPLDALSVVLQWETGLISVVVTLAWAKLLEYLAVFKEMARLLVMIEKMISKLRYFLVLLVVVLAAFAGGEFIAWGYRDPYQATVQWSFLSRIADTFGSLSLHSNVDVDSYLGVIYSIFFILFILLLMLNLVIAILTTAYEDARNASGASYWAKRQYEFIADEDDIKDWFMKDGDEEDEDEHVKRPVVLSTKPGALAATLARFQTRSEIRRADAKRRKVTRTTEMWVKFRMAFRRWCCMPPTADNEKRMCGCPCGKSEEDDEHASLAPGADSAGTQWDTTRQPTRFKKMFSSVFKVPQDRARLASENKGIELQSPGGDPDAVTSSPSGSPSALKGTTVAGAIKSKHTPASGIVPSHNISVSSSINPYLE